MKRPAKRLRSILSEALIRHHDTKRRKMLRGAIKRLRKAEGR